MKKTSYIISLLFMALCSMPCLAFDKGSMLLRGKMCEYDTLVHKQIGPGAWLTQFQFSNVKDDGKTYKMRVHLITVDVTNPYNSLSPYLAKGKYFSVDRQDNDVARMKKEGLKPIATSNGGPFVQSNGSGNGNTAYELSGSVISHGEIFYESTAPTLNFYIDADNRANAGYVSMKGTVTAGSRSYAIGQINHHRDHADKNGEISLFCNGIEKSKATLSDVGTDVLVSVNGGKIKVGSNKCTVKSIWSGSNTPIPSGCALLSGYGISEDFLKSVAVGDELTIDFSYSDSSGNAINPESQITNMVRWTVKDGEVQPNDIRNYPIVSIGSSQDGKTVYWSDMENSPTTSNTPVICLGEFMKNIGAYNAIYLDGGPSAEMTVDGKFITINSIGYGFNGRYIPGGVVLCSEAPTDNDLSYVRLTDPSPLSLKENESATISLLGYNQYGELIDKAAETNAKVEISCSNDNVRYENGVIYAQKKGKATVSFRIQGSSNVHTLNVYIGEDQRLEVSPKKLFTGEDLTCQASLYLCGESGKKQSVSPSLATWSKSGNMVVTSCSDGLIVPYDDGEAEVYVSYNGLTDTMRVVVENIPEGVTDYADMSEMLNAESSRINLQLPSVPEYIYAKVKGSADTDGWMYCKKGWQAKADSIKFHSDANGVAVIYSKIDRTNVADTYPMVADSLSDGFIATELWSCYTDVEPLLGIGNISVSGNTGLRIVRSNGMITMRNDSDINRKGCLYVYSPAGALIATHKFSIPAGGSKLLCEAPKQLVMYRVRIAE